MRILGPIKPFFILGVILVFLGGCAIIPGNVKQQDSIIITYNHPMGDVKITLPPGIPDFTQFEGTPDITMPIDSQFILMGIRYGVPPDYDDSYGLIVSGHEPVVYLMWEYFAEGETDRNWKVVDGECISIPKSQIDVIMQEVYDSFEDGLREGEADESI